MPNNLEKISWLDPTTVNFNPLIDFMLLNFSSSTSLVKYPIFPGYLNAIFSINGFTFLLNCSRVRC